MCAAMRDSEANMKDTNKTYAIVEVIDGEKIQLVRPSFSHHSPFSRPILGRKQGVGLFSLAAI